MNKISASPSDNLFLKQQLSHFVHVFTVFGQQLRCPGVRVA